MTRPMRLAALSLALAAALAPSVALAQACGKRPLTAISCPEGQVWDAAAMLCLPPAV